MDHSGRTRIPKSEKIAKNGKNEQFFQNSSFAPSNEPEHHNVKIAFFEASIWILHKNHYYRLFCNIYKIFTIKNIQKFKFLRKIQILASKNAILTLWCSGSLLGAKFEFWKNCSFLAIFSDFGILVLPDWSILSGNILDYC